MKLFVVLMMSFSLVGMSANEAAVNSNGDEPENTIADVMEKAHGSGLMRKVVKGEATEEEMKELVSLYVDMMDNKPPKGEEEAWNAATGQVVIAATRVMLGREGAGELLQSAANCKKCHDEFK